jgi:hypothetical protein
LKDAKMQGNVSSLDDQIYEWNEEGRWIDLAVPYLSNYIFSIFVAVRKIPLFLTLYLSFSRSTYDSADARAVRTLLPQVVSRSQSSEARAGRGQGQVALLLAIILLNCFRSEIISAPSSYRGDTSQLPGQPAL